MDSKPVSSGPRQYGVFSTVAVTETKVYSSLEIHYLHVALRVSSSAVMLPRHRSFLLTVDCIYCSFVNVLRFSH